MNAMHAIFLVAAFFLSVGTFFGAVAEHTTHRTKTIYISERKTSCESKGGKYSLLYSDFDNDYVELCKTVQTTIKDF